MQASAEYKMEPGGTRGYTKRLLEDPLWACPTETKMSLGCCQRELKGPDSCQKVLVELWEAEIGTWGHLRCTKRTQLCGPHPNAPGGLWGTSKATSQPVLSTQWPLEDM